VFDRKCCFLDWTGQTGTEVAQWRRCNGLYQRGA